MSELLKQKFEEQQRRLQDLRDAAPTIIAEIQKWDAPEPGRPQCLPHHITGVVVDNSSITVASEGHKLNGILSRPSVDETPGNVIKPVVEGDWATVADIPAEVFLTGQHLPIGSEVVLSLEDRSVCRNWRQVQDAHAAASADRNQWNTRIKIQSLARLSADGIAEIPVIDDGFPGVENLNPADVWQVFSQLSDWATVDSFDPWEE